MSSPESPDFDTLDDALSRADAPVGASEAQGMLCGMLCAQGRVDLAGWEKLVLDEPAPGDALAKECHPLLGALFESTRVALNDAVLEFSLLLPDDRDLLHLRTAALREWCQGFLYGFGLAGGRMQADQVPAEVQEVLGDISHMANLESDASQEGEDDESAYAELVEYLRVGVLLMNEMLHPVKAPPRLQ